MKEKSKTLNGNDERNRQICEAKGRYIHLQEDTKEEMSFHRWYR
jgi:hypothetical protein